MGEGDVSTNHRIIDQPRLTLVNPRLSCLGAYGLPEVIDIDEACFFYRLKLIFLLCLHHSVSLSFSQMRHSLICPTPKRDRSAKAQRQSRFVTHLLERKAGSNFLDARNG